MKKFLFPAIALFVSLSASATGFGLYEASAASHALGGTVLGRAVDASANFFNPATLSDFTNTVVTLGFVTEHPHGRMHIEGHGHAVMDPGIFALPHAHVVVPLPYDFTFGIGVMPEYGLGSEYSNDWALRFNSVDTTVKSFTFNPNLAYRVTEDWSVAAGARLLFFDFEQHSYPASAAPGQYANHQRLKGDNGMSDCGWQIGTRYRVRPDLAFGAVYKSETRVHVEGTSHFMNTTSPMAQYLGLANLHGPAKTMLVLPQSITGGFNWDIADDVHLGTSIGWAEWSSVETLKFRLNRVTKPINLKWKDTWRFGVAPSWDFADDWTWMASYVYETDCSRNQESTMLPPSKRHILTTGLAWHVTPNLEIDASVGVVLMSGLKSSLHDSSGGYWTYEAHRAFCTSAGLSLSYSF